MPEKLVVIFACVHNAGRSQMAAAWFRHFAPREKATAISAGTQPGSQIHPEVMTVMQEVGINLQGQIPQMLTAELASTARLMVTMGCGENCPFVPGLEVRDWPLKDPKGQSLDEVRQIRDEIRDRVRELVDQLLN